GGGGVCPGGRAAAGRVDRLSAGGVPERGRGDRRDAGDRGRRGRRGRGGPAVLGSGDGRAGDPAGHRASVGGRGADPGRPAHGGAGGRHRGGGGGDELLEPGGAVRGGRVRPGPGGRGRRRPDHARSDSG